MTTCGSQGIHFEWKMELWVLLSVLVWLRVALFSSGFPQGRSVKLIFTGGHISLVVAFKGLNVILGLYKCNYSLTRSKELGAAAG